MPAYSQKSSEAAIPKARFQSLPATATLAIFGAKDYRMAKHVIFLGAGASASSHYPLANELRLWMCSEHHFLRAMEKRGVHLQHAKKIGQFFDSVKESTGLFRRGAFGSVDEFCKLMSGHEHEEKVNEMRRLSRFVLGLFNPEDHFEDSDYYPFVQRLFDRSLRDFRNDIAVFTFNYDGHLDYVLLQACEERRRIAGRKFNLDLANSITSGFYEPGGNSEIKMADGFCLLKLHGSICQGQLGQHGYPNFFKSDVSRRLESLGHENPLLPPIVFPWEVFDEKGEFRDDRDFPLKDQEVKYHALFRNIWERAKHEIEPATKISFVGLSLHPFLENALKYLFGNKGEKVEVVVANPGNSQFSRFPDVVDHPKHSPARKAVRMLLEAAPNLLVGNRRLDGSYAQFTEVRPLDSFREFIEKEMD